MRIGRINERVTNGRGACDKRERNRHRDRPLSVLWNLSEDDMWFWVWPAAMLRPKVIEPIIRHVDEELRAPRVRRPRDVGHADICEKWGRHIWGKGVLGMKKRKKEFDS